MTTLSEYFDLRKSQGELDFVDVNPAGDNPLFIDPFAISQRSDPLSHDCHGAIVDFFTRVVEAIRTGNEEIALELLSHLREPNETRLGYSEKEPRGAGIGADQTRDIFEALRDSSAVRTGFISSLQECELLIPGIGRDKISDLTTNVIRAHLAAYTAQQCNLHGIPVHNAPLPPVFNAEHNRWESRYHALPLASGRPVLLVPKAFVRYDPAYSHVRYYRYYVLEYLQAEHLSAHTSLVRTLKDGRTVVRKNDLQAKYPCTKQFLYEFSRNHPGVLRAYESDLGKLEPRRRTPEVSLDEEKSIARALAEALRQIVPGSDNASVYHSLMIGALEFIFFPELLNPKKECEIHEGRKRIDIVMENGARTGIFNRLHQVRHIPCQFVVFECKNYGRDVANPELDQLTGRFAPRRGKVGFLCCRAFENKGLFIERCRDTFRDDRGLAVPLDDEFLLEVLGTIEAGSRDKIDAMLTTAINEVAFA